MFHQRAESLRLNGLGAARRFFTDLLSEIDGRREHLWIAHVDDDSRCIHVSHHQGDAAGAEVPLRQLVFDAAIHGSAGLVLAHNHPSGDPTPSPADQALTQRVALLGEAMGVTVLDHLVLAGKECRSMRAMGLL